MQIGRICFTVLVVLVFQCIAYTQSLSAVILDEDSRLPVPYATIQYSENNGIISNEEGRFALDSSILPEEIDSLYISCMGYEKKAYAFSMGLDTVMLLKPKAIELSGVYLFDEPMTAGEIIEKARSRLSVNYKMMPVNQRFFLRQSSLNSIGKFDLDVRSSSIEELNTNFMDSLVRAIPRGSAYYTETLGDFYRKEKVEKLKVIKAAELFDKSNDASLDALGKKMERIFRENVKPDSYLKIKSGIFGTKVEVDSILEETAQEGDTSLTSNVNSGFHKYRKQVMSELYSGLFYQEDAHVDVMLKPSRYHFQLEGFTDIGEEGVYVISFSPKRRADFSGRLYINISDFAIMRLDYKNERPLRKFRLLGLSYRESVSRGSVRFSRIENGSYEVSFLESIFVRNMGVKRPLKVIEKNKNVRGRRKQNELSMAVNISNNYTEKLELVVFSSELSGLEPPFSENEKVKAQYLPKYDPDFWKGHQVIEPNRAIREFTAME